MVDALTTGRDYGVSLAYQQERWRLRFGLFTEMDQDGEGATDRDSAWSFAGRLNVTPMKEKTQVVHLGGGFVYESAEDESSVRFRARPDSHVSDTRLIDTNSHGYDSILRYGLELGVMGGPFTAMAEWIKAKVDRYDWVNEADVADFDADGYYIQVGYVLTGESRGYTNGTWKNPKPNSIVGQGGHGAWELALRWSNLDLNDNDLDGGEEDNLSVGLNWYLTPTILMRADYTTVLEVDGGQKDGVEPSIFQVRTQYEF